MPSLRPLASRPRALGPIALPTSGLNLPRTPLHICVVTASFSFTGVALAQVRFARALSARGHRVDLVFGWVDRNQVPPDFAGLPEIPGVNSILWDAPRARSMFGPLRRYLKDAKPDVVFSAEDQLNDMVLLAAIAAGSRAKISGSSRVFPLDQPGHDGPYSNQPFTKQWAFKQVTRVAMRRADVWTCVSDDLATAYRDLFGSNKFERCYNIIVDKESLERLKEPVDHPWFADGQTPIVTSAGTLTLRKGFPDLVRAMRIVHDRGRQVRLAILGEGPMRGELEALIRELKLEEWVWLAGRVENPLKYFAHSHVSALASYSEGLANVIIESMMAGCVPVATDCPVGPRDALQGGKYGYLVPMHDPAALAGGIISALDRPISPELLVEGTRPFEADAVIDRHFQLLGIDGA